ncbi:MAG TPA: NAD(P)/FAD-dependent oxidoreductase [Saprospiraceae bacterium]|nr:NAD(P)/FAD-dependent oxidoreductase [Saprospiraceae bacterium]
MINHEILDVLIIGAGQAGLSTSYFLKENGISHVVLERGKIGNSWEKRWDSFRLNSPHQYNLLPGEPPGSYHIHDFITGHDFIERLAKYAHTHKLPVLENSNVISLKKSSVDDTFIVETIQNGQNISWSSKQVVIAAGGENNACLPQVSDQVPEKIFQLHAIQYSNPSKLPEGAVLVVGSGTSGVQIAEDLIAANRKVYLATSAVTRAPRRYRGRDIVEWMADLHFFDKPTAVAEDFELNMKAPLMSGVGASGHTISLQSLHRQGVILMGHLNNINQNVFKFENNLADNIKFGDDFSTQVKNGIDQFILATGVNAEPPEFDEADFPDDSLLTYEPASQLDLDDHYITSIIWATGFKPDFSWIKVPVLDELGKAIHSNGITTTKGLYFNGLPWLRNLKSSLIYGVVDDAKFITNSILENHHARTKVLA